MKKRSIGLWLDGYDDIFSDFDPRPYSQRAISDDFMSEAKKMFRENPSGRFELRLLVPPKTRHTETERVVARRLRQYFNLVRASEEAKISNLFKEGALYSLLGFASLFGAFLISRTDTSSLILNALLIILEPAGWFTVWTGLDKIFTETPEVRKGLSFYTKMEQAEVSFGVYDD